MLRSGPSPLLRLIGCRASSSSASTPISSHNAQGARRPLTRIEAVELANNPSLETIALPNKTFTPKSSRSPNSPSMSSESIETEGGKVKSRFSALGARLLAARQSKSDYSAQDEEAVQVLSMPSHAIRTHSNTTLRGSEIRPQWQRPVQAARTDREVLNPTMREGRSRGGNATPSIRSNPRTNVQGRPSTPGAVRAPAGPRKPLNRKPKRQNGVSGGMATSSQTPLPTPKRFAEFKPIQLSDLIKRELIDGQLRLVDSPFASPSTSTKEKTATSSSVAQSLRLAKRQELQGDYSRFFFESDSTKPLDPTSKVQQLANLRRILNTNTSVGLAQTNFIVGKVQEAFGTK